MYKCKNILPHLKDHFQGLGWIREQACKQRTLKLRQKRGIGESQSSTFF